MRQAQPKPKPPTPPQTKVRVSGNQADHVTAATNLAAELGWAGEPDWVVNDIEVRDAIRYLTKSLHEAFQAAANGEPCPSSDALCEYLAVDTPEELAAVSAAVDAAYESGKGAAVSEVSVKQASLSGSGTRSANEVLGAFSKGQG